MQNRDDRALEILRELGSRPAAPFFERNVAQYILETLENIGVEAYRDAYGNIIAHYKNVSDSATPQPPIAFMAHMDHPGFEIIEASEGRIVARALGGVPVASLKKPTPVLILLPDGERMSAEVVPPDEPLSQDASRASGAGEVEVGCRP